MRSIRRLISQAHHRNGVAGEGFVVSLFEPRGHSRSTRFVAVSFYGDDEQLDPTRTAVLDVGLLSEGVIGFGVNSWRGDEYGPELAAAWKESQ